MLAISVVKDDGWFGDNAAGDQAFHLSGTPGLVPRARLARRLNGILASRLTLFSAPVGFGKTILVSERVHRCQPPVPIAWLSLEEGENDPARFWARTPP